MSHTVIFFHFGEIEDEEHSFGGKRLSEIKEEWNVKKFPPEEEQAIIENFQTYVFFLIYLSLPLTAYADRNEYFHETAQILRFATQRTGFAHNICEIRGATKFSGVVLVLRPGCADHLGGFGPGLRTAFYVQDTHYLPRTRSMSFNRHWFLSELTAL
ncbi:hypothetical protein FBUS_09938 [Fasciolopsis buskii]|uniref:Uncharacterized protein n=1 Tax=Fasciolopsis buskii TaxID=27845 RepID=A0A8E0RYR8_9TREM|nr:hypothetical protein FBUS_09938 [Fasciolopsis buski]